MNEQDLPEDFIPSSQDRDHGDDVGSVRQLARRGKKELRRILRIGIQELNDQLLEQALDLLSSPEHVEALQHSLANIAGWTLRRGFKSDPNAELLFEFVDWLEQRHPRQTITAIILRSPMLRDTAFLDALAHLSQSINPFDASTTTSKWSVENLARFKVRAGNRLLDLLVELAALECDAPPPDGPPKDKIDYFEQSPIPVRFLRLAGMTRGHQLLTPQSPSRRRRLLKSITDRLRPWRSSDSAIAKFVPGLGDETLHFLVFSTTFFLQSYLLRNLIEALPDIAADLRLQLRDDQLINITDGPTDPG